MKKILFCLCLILLLSSSECETGNKVSNKDAYDLYTDTVNGHEYIIMRAMYSGKHHPFGKLPMQERRAR